ncbi:MAG: RNA-binding S4 domain-containing protein [Prevotella sp.]|nr:RNA-binding S4 domain-containing protein [Prevotella sp.]
MEYEVDNNKQEQAAQQQETNREEGFNTQSGNYQKDYRNEGRTQRPRIHTQRAYSSEHGRTEEGGFRPEGFGAGLQSTGTQQRPNYRPRFNSNPNSYQQRPARYGQIDSQQQGYQPRPQGFRPRYNQADGEQQGYQPRPRYNNYDNGEQGYQPRPRFNSNTKQGYQPRYQNTYQPRPRFNSNGEEGYQPHYQGGYQPRQSRYNSQEGPQGYQPRGAYQPRPRTNGMGYAGKSRQQGYDPNAKYNLKKRIEYKEENIDPNEPIRLNKFLANAGVCSRREADEYILAGNVTVNGEVVKELGTKIQRSDSVMFHERPVSLEKKVYVLLNKPKDYVTTSDDPQQRKTVMDLVKDVCPERIYPVGRLDRNTTGVLLLTNDGDLASKLTHPKFLKKKVYHVFLDKNISAHDMQQIAEGIELEDGEVHADSIEYPDEKDKSQVGIEIHSGKNRIVRRIFEHMGYRVVKLDRVQFAGLTKKNLRRGDWRFLTQKEVEILRMGAFE